MSSAASPRRLALSPASLLPPALIIAAGAAMLWWTWGGWPDPVVDFGKEIYIAWQLASGKTLYTDIAYFNGPLSPYLDALWLRAFGVSFRTLALCNIAVASLITAMLFGLLREIAGRFAATAGCLLFVLLFAFAQFTPNGNYNFVCPITHEMTHGTALSLAAILAVDLYQKSRRPVWIAVCGAAIGLVFLTRAEFFLAAASAALVGLGFAVRAERQSARSAGSRLALFAAFALVGPVLAFTMLATAMPARAALLGTLGTWPTVLKGEVARLPFYQRGLGLEDPGASALRLLTLTLAEGAFLVVAALIASRARPSSRGRMGAAGLAFAAVAVPSLLPREWIPSESLARLLPRDWVPWEELARPLPIAIVALGLMALIKILKAPPDDPAARPLVLRLALVAFGFGLLLKMILNVRIFHYGFALAMPAALVGVCGLLEWLPAWIERRGGTGWILRAAALGALFSMTVVFLEGYGLLAARKNVAVGRGADLFFADERGAAVNQVLGELALRAGPSDTLAVMPEGGFLNYLSRRPNSTPFPILMPTEMTMFGEDRILEAFRASPPDFIALVHRDTSEFAVRFFGRDYAGKIYAWVQDTYEPVFQAGALPFRDEHFGITLMELKGRAAQDGAAPALPRPDASAPRP